MTYWTAEISTTRKNYQIKYLNIDWLINWIVFNAVSAIYQPSIYNGGKK